MPKTQGKAFTQSGEASSKDSMALVSVSKNSPPVRVLSLMEKDRLASEFVRVGERVLVDLSRKKCMYFQFHPIKILSCIHFQHVQKIL